MTFMAALAKFAYKKPDQYFIVGCIIFALCVIAIAAAIGGKWAADSYYEQLVQIAPDNNAYLKKIQEIWGDVVGRLRWLVIGSGSLLLYVCVLSSLKLFGLVDQSSS